MQNPINLLPVSQFIQQVRTAELSQQREVRLTLQQAKLLALAVTELQTKLLQDLQQAISQVANTSNKSTPIGVDGGVF